jgi:hypothetical protein
VTDSSFVFATEYHYNQNDMSFDWLMAFAFRHSRTMGDMNSCRCPAFWENQLEWHDAQKNAQLRPDCHFWVSPIHDGHDNPRDQMVQTDRPWYGVGCMKPVSPDRSGLLSLSGNSCLSTLNRQGERPLTISINFAQKSNVSIKKAVIWRVFRAARSGSDFLQLPVLSERHTITNKYANTLTGSKNQIISCDLSIVTPYSTIDTFNHMNLSSGRRFLFDLSTIQMFEKRRRSNAMWKNWTLSCLLRRRSRLLWQKVEVSSIDC